jgi:nucleotide-binding universal stress UspA family protein
VFRDILVTVDPDSPESYARALPQAVELARTHGATLHVMTVVPDFGSSMVASFFPAGFEKKALGRAEEALLELTGTHVPVELEHQIVVAHGRIYQEICRVAEEVKADLVVMASHKPAARDKFVAPNAQQVLQRTSASVLIVR